MFVPSLTDVDDASAISDKQSRSQDDVLNKYGKELIHLCSTFGKQGIGGVQGMKMDV